MTAHTPLASVFLTLQTIQNTFAAVAFEPCKPSVRWVTCFSTSITAEQLGCEVLLQLPRPRTMQSWSCTMAHHKVAPVGPYIKFLILQASLSNPTRLNKSTVLVLCTQTELQMTSPLLEKGLNTLDNHMLFPAQRLTKSSVQVQPHSWHFQPFPAK